MGYSGSTIPHAFQDFLVKEWSYWSNTVDVKETPYGYESESEILVWTHEIFVYANYFH